MNDANRSTSATHAITCPSCGGSLSPKSMREVVYCPWCGNAIYLSLPTDGRNVEADGTVRDVSTGYGLFRIKIPSDWQVMGTALSRTGTSSRPYVAQAELRDQSGGTIALRIGDAGTRNSAGTNALMATYGRHLAGIDTSNYAEVPDPNVVADKNASAIASSAGGVNLRFVRQLAFDDLEGERAKIIALLKQQSPGMGSVPSNPLVGIVCRIYEFTVNGRPWQLASFVRLEAIKRGPILGEEASNALEGIADSIGDMLGGAFRGRGSLFSRRQQPTPQEQPMQAPDQAQTYQAPSQASAWCTPEFSQYVSSGTIKWGIPLMATYIAPVNSFDAQLNAAFLPLVSTLEIHSDVKSLTTQAIQQESAQIQTATQGQIARSQQAFQMQRAAHQQQQAAFDSYNAAWQARSDAQHQQFRAATSAQFNTPAGGAAPSYSEAIRGVNTYTTSDGREVEVTIRADRAYENQAGDVIGTSGSFEPGASWTEIPRS